MGKVLTDRAPETDDTGMIARNMSANGSVSQGAGTGDEVDILSKGGSSVIDTDHADKVTGGGKAVPDASFFQGRSSTGDDLGDSLDDGAAGQFGGGVADTTGSAGTV